MSKKRILCLGWASTAVAMIYRNHHFAYSTHLIFAQIRLTNLFEMSIALATLNRTGTTDNDYRSGNRYPFVGRYNLRFSGMLHFCVGININ